MNRWCASAVVLSMSVMWSSNATAKKTRLCVSRVSVVEPSFITVLDAPSEVASNPNELNIELGDEPKAEPEVESETPVKSIIEYGDQPTDAVEGLEVVRGDELSSGNGIEVTRGDEANDADFIDRGDEDSEPGDIDLFRGDQQPVATDSRALMPGLFGLDPKLFGDLVSLQPTMQGFNFTFDNLVFAVTQTPSPESMDEALRALLPTKGKSHVRIETAKKDCIPAVLAADELRLDTRSGHTLNLKFPKAKKLKNATKNPNALVLEFRDQMSMKASK